MFFSSALTLDSVKRVIAGSEISSYPLLCAGIPVCDKKAAHGDYIVMGNAVSARNFTNDYYTLLVTTSSGTFDQSVNYAVFGPYDLTNYNKLYVNYRIEQGAGGNSYYECGLESTNVIPNDMTEWDILNTVVHTFEQCVQKVGALGIERNLSCDIRSFVGDHYLFFATKSNVDATATHELRIKNAWLVV